MDRSKLPVPRRDVADKPRQEEPALPCRKKSCPPQPVLPLFSKEPNIAFSGTVPQFRGATSGKNLAVSKKTAPPARGPVHRYRMDRDLKTRNQLLEAENAGLSRELLSTQHTIREMSEKTCALREELQEAQQRLGNNMIILESQNIDPVLGEQIISRDQETRKLREERRAVTEALSKELELCRVTAREQIKCLQAVKETWKKAQESRAVFLEEQEAFQKDLDQFRAALDDTEQWLGL